MKSLFKTAIVLASLTPALAFSESRLSTDNRSVLMFVHQTVDNTGTSNTVTKVGGLNYSKNGNYNISSSGATDTGAARFVGALPKFSPPQAVFGSTVSCTTGDNASCSLNPPAINYGANPGDVAVVCAGQLMPPTADQIQGDAVNFFVANKAALGAQMSSHMKKYGIPAAFFRYEQSVQVPTDLNAAVVATTTTDTSPAAAPDPCAGQTDCVLTYGCDSQGYCSIWYPSDHPGEAYPGPTGMPGNPEAGYGGTSDGSGTTTTTTTYTCDPSRIPFEQDRVVMSAYVDQNGKMIWGMPTVTRSSARILAATYTTLALDDNLPASLAHTNGGKLTYHVDDQNFNTLTPETTIDTGGAYDPNPNDTSADPGVTCLVNNSNPGCSPQNFDLRSLMGSTGATVAILQYVTPWTVSSQSVDGVAADGSPAAVVTPQFTLNVLQNQLAYETCGPASYVNSGNYQFTLQSEVDQYLVNSDGTFSRVNQMPLTNQAPPQSYTLTQTPLTSMLSSLPSYVIDPLDGNQLLPVSSLPGQNIAPLTTTGPIPPAAIRYPISYQGTTALCLTDTQQIAVPQCESGYTPYTDGTTLGCEMPITGPFCPQGDTEDTAQGKCLHSAPVSLVPWGLP
ncbi:hypothetical protein F6X40_10660 [Paraburkholderia sp. UCT31]|uniref:hypothetical protein n=1 Tax=Paraburkholderia sp. UCT31 TaxID=2615209 RepID=UPI00165610D3|nr:hypothetical protein [Paraburkholderia sp. UCT31]MBC8737269.1 hypothetical protein [Paraburkholderia sp. UCT31]